jgi:hypothetical protein
MDDNSDKKYQHKLSVSRYHLDRSAVGSPLTLTYTILHEGIDFIK